MPIARAFLPEVFYGSGGGLSGQISQTQLPTFASRTVGDAVALIHDGLERVFVPCSATTYAENFCGFLTRVSETNPLVMASRGSVVTVLVVGDIDLVLNQPVYLSSTLGRVTQTPPMGPGTTVLRVGFAVGTDSIVINTDLRFTT